jgi:hypothetical protein
MAKDRDKQQDSTDTTTQQDQPPRRLVFCKVYHSPRVAADPGRTRRNTDVKSRCPSWAADTDLRQALIDEALEDPGGAEDFRGRPKKLWNAVERLTFIGVSCNMNEPLYNCYPESPPNGKLLLELLRRAERTRDEVPRRTGRR